MEKKNGKQLEYAAIIIGKIGEIFEGDIDAEELLEEDNAQDFIYALSSLVPSHIHNGLFGDKKNALEFNHLANDLIFKYAKIKEE